MPLLKRSEQKVEKQEQKEKTQIGIKENLNKGILYEPLPEDYSILEIYSPNERYKDIARVVIVLNNIDNTVKYYVDEPKLSDREAEALQRLIEVIESEINPYEIPKGLDLRTVVLEIYSSLVDKYKKMFKKLNEESWTKIKYYIERNLLGYGPIDLIFKDQYVEDISCNGVNTNIFVWHRRYESIPTNVVFIDKEALDSYVMSLVHKAGKHISIANPTVDAMLEGKHRLAATYGEEITPQGSTFTIRKFRESPLSIIDLIDAGTLTPDMAAYLWLIVEYKMPIIIFGSTAAGKTTLLNAILNLVKPGYKIVTVEETPEINVPSENWIRLISREVGIVDSTIVKPIELFDLVKLAMRYRPDYLVVGEIRGEEAYVLVQAIATGHGGLTTIHAETVSAMMIRLTSPPMNIPQEQIPLLKVAINIERVPLPKPRLGLNYGRRVKAMYEIISYDQHIQLSRWDPTTDNHEFDVSNSNNLKVIAALQGKNVDELINELFIRKSILEWMVWKDIRDIKEVAKVINQYYMDKNKLVEKAMSDYIPRLENVIDFRKQLILRTLKTHGVPMPISDLINSVELSEDLFWETLNELISEKKITIDPKGYVHLIKE